ncbi:MAG: hypothetical protein COA79_16110 [Planctomycetota bacterium]|nr:MAG: hypothetical protein COA79_16110 [Planctomycetota bacterium]
MKASVDCTREKIERSEVINKGVNLEVKIKECLEAGIAAPSGDNVQPWRFLIKGNQVEFHRDPKDKSFFNVNQRATYLSCGALLENVIIAGKHNGLKSEMQTFSAEERGTLFAIIDFSETEKEPQPLMDCILKREANRKMYSKEIVPDSFLERLKQQLSDEYNVDLTSTYEKKEIGEIVFLSTRLMLERQDVHEYLHAHIHLDDEYAEKIRTGFKIKNLEAGFVGELFLKFTRPWSRMKVMVKLGMGRAIGRFTEQSVNKSSHTCFLTIKDPSDHIGGGREMQRFWLELTMAGIVAQPVTAPVFLYLRAMEDGKPVFDKLYHKIYDKFMDKFDVFAKKNSIQKDGLFMHFRIGYSDSLKTRSLRQDLDKFLM